MLLMISVRKSEAQNKILNDLGTHKQLMTHRETQNRTSHWARWWEGRRQVDTISASDFKKSKNSKFLAKRNLSKRSSRFPEKPSLSKTQRILFRRLSILWSIYSLQTIMLRKKRKKRNLCSRWYSSTRQKTVSLRDIQRVSAWDL